MHFGLKGKVALVAASSKGLGFASAMALAAEGAKVVICGRRPEQLASAAQQIRQATSGEGGEVHTFPGDITDSDTIVRYIKAGVSKFGQIDILVTNGGGPAPGEFNKIADKDWLSALDSTLWPVIRMIRSALPYLHEAGQRGGGRIINIVSTSVKQPIAGLLLSNAIRPAVIGLAKTLSFELASQNILVNNVCPGSFDTDRLRQIYEAKAGNSPWSAEEIAEQATKVIPLSRLGEPKELGALVAFLASSQSSYITGQTICVDGGMTNTLFG